VFDVVGADAHDAAVRVPYRGSRSELIDVLDLGRGGRIDVATQTSSLDDGPRADADLTASTIRGRAVIVPERGTHGSVTART
jgi:propanol-preferring alcohol dehydrogenase